VELGKQELDIDNIPDIDTVVSMCSGLDVVDGVSDIVRLGHYTTQDYLEFGFMKWKPDPREEIASACLTYVPYDVFRAGRRSANDGPRTGAGIEIGTRTGMRSGK